MTPTPAPWKVTVLDQAVFIHGGPDNDEIADFSFADEHVVSISKDEAIANATLCAAAPDLLAALKNMVMQLVTNISARDAIGDAAWATARAAISKATTVAP